VYPAAGLIHYVPVEIPKFVVDPKIPEVGTIPYLTMIADKASTGMKTAQEKLMQLI
jgi:NAD-dependent deacetylase